MRHTLGGLSGTSPQEPPWWLAAESRRSCAKLPLISSKWSTEIAGAGPCSAIAARGKILPSANQMGHNCQKSYKSRGDQATRFKILTPAKGHFSDLHNTASSQHTIKALQEVEILCCGRLVGKILWLKSELYLHLTFGPHFSSCILTACLLQLTMIYSFFQEIKRWCNIISKRYDRTWESFKWLAWHLVQKENFDCCYTMPHIATVLQQHRKAAAWTDERCLKECHTLED